MKQRTANEILLEKRSELPEGYQHVHWKGSTPSRFEIAVAGGQRKKVPGRIFGGWIGLHMNNQTRKWTATHLGTGLAFAFTEFQEEELIRRVKALESTFGDRLNFLEADRADPEVVAGMRTVGVGLR